MTGQLPDFLVIGVQKGGTTSLQRMLEQHPGAFLPQAKELHYFSLHYNQGEAWYRQQFAGAAPGQCCCATQWSGRCRNIFMPVAMASSP